MVWLALGYGDYRALEALLDLRDLVIDIPDLISLARTYIVHRKYWKPNRVSLYIDFVTEKMLRGNLNAISS